MKKAKKGQTAAKNVPYQKHAGLQFGSSKAWKEAQKAVLLQVWRRMEEFKEGWVCGYGGKGDANLVCVYSEGNKVKIAINRFFQRVPLSLRKRNGKLLDRYRHAPRKGIFYCEEELSPQS